LTKKHILTFTFNNNIFQIDSYKANLWKGTYYDLSRAKEFARGFVSNFVDSVLITEIDMDKKFYMNKEERNKRFFDL
jgi:hypothetical protein